MNRKRSNSQTDHREMPAYTIAEAAHFLNVSASTIRYWSVGRNHYESLITPAAIAPLTLLSFLNLVELHILAAIRREHEVSMPKVRSAIEYMRGKFPSAHPLISHEFETDGVSLFIEHLGALINISQYGQIAIREVVGAALKRIVRDTRGIPIKLYPFTRPNIKDSPSVVVIDPTLSAGRPVIAGTGIPTEIIAERYKAGDSVKDLMRDYGRNEEEIEEAIRCELSIAA